MAGAATRFVTVVGRPAGETVVAVLAGQAGHQPVDAARYIDYDYWVELSGGTRQAADAAARVRAGVTVFGVSNDGMLGMARAVADGAP